MPILSRRTALLTGAAVVAAPAITGQSPMISSALAQTMATQAPGFYKFKVGDAIVTAVNDGFFSRPLEGFIRNAELPAVQEAMKSAFLPTDKVNIPFTTLVVETGGKLILLDTGQGEFGPPTSGTWMNNFKAAGYDPAKVTDVIISHFHGDHINGVRKKDGTLAFANAQMHVPAPEYAFWMSDERMNAAPEAMKGAFQNVKRTFGPDAAKIKQYEPGKDVVSGITSIPAFGHTPGHCAMAITSGNAKFMFMADITNHPALFVRNPDWSAIFDMDADAARATRRKMLDMVATDRMQVAFYHAPFPATGYVTKAGNGFDLIPVQWSNAI